MANKNKNSLQYRQNLYMYREENGAQSEDTVVLTIWQTDEQEETVCVLSDVPNERDDVHYTLVLPRQMLERRLRDIERLFHEPFHIQPIVRQYLLFFMDHQDVMDGHAHSILMNAFLDLFVEGLSDCKVAPTSKHRLELLQSIKQYIRDNIRNPALSPTSIAQTFSISTRYIHDLFKTEGITVSNYILDTRLEKCRRNLVRVHPEKKKVIDIAFKWGFNDAAYFSKVFKKRYGVAPSKYEEL